MPAMLCAPRTLHSQRHLRYDERTPPGAAVAAAESQLSGFAAHRWGSLFALMGLHAAVILGTGCRGQSSPQRRQNHREEMMSSAALDARLGSRMPSAARSITEGAAQGTQNAPSSDAQAVAAGCRICCYRRLCRMLILCLLRSSFVVSAAITVAACC